MFKSIINPRCQSVNTISNNNNDMVRSSTLMDIDMITLSDLIDIIVRRRVLFMVVIAIFVVMGGLMALLKTPKYEFTQMIVSAQINPIEVGGHLAPQALVLQSPAVINGVLQNDILLAANSDVDEQVDNSKGAKLALSTTVVGDTAIALKTTAPLAEKSLVRQRYDRVLTLLQQHQQRLVAMQRDNLIDSIKGIQQQQQKNEQLSASLGGNGARLLKVSHSAMPSPQALLKDTRPASVGGSADTAEMIRAVNAFTDQQRLQFMASLVYRNNALNTQLLVAKQSLASLSSSRFSGGMVVSDEPVGLSAVVLFVLMVLMGVMVAFFMALAVEFTRKT